MMQLNSSENSLVTVESAKAATVQSQVSPWLMGLLYPLAHFIVLPFYFSRIEISGQENLPKDGPVIIAPTHRSRWDAIVISYATGRYVTGRDLRYMVTADEVKGVQGWFIRRLGGFAVNVRHPAIATLRHGVELLRERRMLVIFPEGGIFQDGQLHPLKPGLARLALQAESIERGLGVKIVPISIRYSQLIPRWGCNLTIRIGSPLSVASYCKENIKQSAQKLTEDLQRILKNLDEQEK